jgi:hypothetical protein
MNKDGMGGTLRTYEYERDNIFCINPGDEGMLEDERND